MRQLCPGDNNSISNEKVTATFAVAIDAEQPWFSGIAPRLGVPAVHQKSRDSCRGKKAPSASNFSEGASPAAGVMLNIPPLIHEVTAPWQLPSPSPTPSARSSIFLILPSRPPLQCPGLPLLLLMLVISPVQFIATIRPPLMNMHVCMYPKTFSSFFLLPFFCPLPPRSLCQAPSH